MYGGTAGKRRRVNLKASRDAYQEALAGGAGLTALGDTRHSEEVVLEVGVYGMRCRLKYTFMEYDDDLLQSPDVIKRIRR